MNFSDEEERWGFGVLFRAQVFEDGDGDSERLGAGREGERERERERGDDGCTFRIEEEDEGGKRRKGGVMVFLDLFDGMRSRHLTGRRGKFVVRLGFGKRVSLVRDVGSFGFLRIGTVPKRLDWKLSSPG